MTPSLEKIDDYRYLLPRSGAMRVPGLLYADADIAARASEDGSLDQVAAVASLPGIERHALAMPDIHHGYGAPIGAVAAFDARQGAVVPGIVGYDINCGVRLLGTGIPAVAARERLDGLLDHLYRAVPCGAGGGGRLRLDTRRLEQVLAQGAAWTVREGYGTTSDLLLLEDSGQYPEADPDRVSRKALERGADQLGTLGGGNHFLECQAVERIYDREAARAYGLEPGTLAIMIHTGSRGLGHQVAGDYLRVFENYGREKRLSAPDRQLAWAPADSGPGRDYLGAMAAAANFAVANRQVIAHEAALALGKFFGDSATGVKTVYDIAHNIARVEEHRIPGGGRRRLLVHRKGATRSFHLERPETPAAYSAHGHPVLLPGTMGTASFVMRAGGRAEGESWASTAHGAGRALSRRAAADRARGRSIIDELAAAGVRARAPSRRALDEEFPGAYKDIDRVVAVISGAGLAKPVARLEPLAVLKG